MQQTGEIKMKTEVPTPVKRRHHSKAYKLRIIQEYDSCTRPGEKGELLRQEGLYSSTITDWRRQLLINDQEKTMYHHLSVENARLRKELDISRKVIDVQKKILEISELGTNEK